MSKSTDTEVCTHYAESSEHNCQGFIFFAHTFFDVVHRATGNVTVVVNSTIFYSQQAFCIFGSHTEECSNPHPEQCTRTTHFNCGSNTYDVTSTYSCSKSSTQSLKATYVAFTFTFSTKDKFQSGSKFEDLNEFQTNGEPNAGTNQQDKERRAPDKRINCVQHFQHFFITSFFL